MTLKHGIGIPNNNFLSDEIPPSPGSLYVLETSTFPEFNYVLESGNGFYRLEQNYITPTQYKFLMESGLGVYELESGLGDYRLEDQ
jgi:hypothetical protein